MLKKMPSLLHIGSHLTLAFALISTLQSTHSGEIHSQVQHGYAQNGETKIHFASLGEGPLVVMIHGFPDFWYTWRDQMESLSSSYQTVAMDQRGYNRSDQPEGQEHYAIHHLVEDVRQVVLHHQETPAIIVGHDWGGFVAWQFAMKHPELTRYLIILNLPHPRGLSRELANNPDQQRNSAYARRFQEPNAHQALTAEGLSEWVQDPAARQHYIEAFRRSSFEGMLSYYKQNYPRPPYQEASGPVVKVKSPILMFHGLDDWALLPSGLNDTWTWVEQDLTLVTVPNAGHFVQQDASERVSKTIANWLALQSSLDK